ncbi:unnamed protein product [Knipowitschia caucasica]|uniref:Rap guanine nucleotide exchange factor 5 n=1 Tax=Knipowitschia caucasica TaxID=637954 RepID=A0AAV2MDJ3_KNICA
MDEKRGKESVMWDCGLRQVFGPHPPHAPHHSSRRSILQVREELSRLEMVHRLAKDGCRLLQNHGKSPEKMKEPRSDEAGRELQALRASVRGGAPEEARFSVMSGTPDKILENLLNDLRVEDEQGNTQGEDTLLDDFLLTYPVFMTTSDLCQALLGHFCSKRSPRKEERTEVLRRKQKVLRLVLQWMNVCRRVLREDHHVKAFLKTLYRYALGDLYEHPALEKELRELQEIYQMHRRNASDDYSPHRKSKALFHQLSFKDNGFQPRAAHRETKEVLCHVYISLDSYLSVRASGDVVARELLQAVAERMDVPVGDLLLVAIAFPGGRLLLQPQDKLFSDTLRPIGRLHVCRKDLGEVLNPFTDNSELQQRTTHMLSLNAWDVAVALTNLDWALFNSVHEQQLVYFSLSRRSSGAPTVALELLLSRSNEVQLWVMTEVLLCPALCKRVQLIKKFIKIAAHCKAQKNLNCFFAIIMGLNSAAVSRLTQTWEKIPGKFKKLFSELETTTDPSLNHKVYREAFRKMKSPKIPFLPLLLKDITFIHEGNKTFHDNLVNFEKLHMIAEAARVIRQCQNDAMGTGITQKSSPEVRAYVDFLHIIDNQQTLFELSVKLEPRA